MKRALVAHNVPKHLIEKLPISQAGNYFTFNLIGGGFFQHIFSLIPTNITIPDIVPNDDTIEYIHFRKLPNKSIFKFCNVLVENIKLIALIKKNKIENLWFYNLTIHTLVAFVFLKYFSKNTRLYVLLLDFTPSKRKWSLQNLILYYINNANGIISLSKNDIIQSLNYKILPGIVPETQGEKLMGFNYNFLLSGILSDNRNPKLILDLFSKLPEFTLYITGVFTDEKLLNEYLNKFSNIKFLGLLEYDDYIGVLNNCTYCINSRDPNYPENNYNFPSKVIEYLQHNRIVISTMQYDELKNVDYIFLDPNANQIEMNLKRKINDIDLLKKCANQSIHVNELFGYNKWDKTLNEIEN